MSKHCWCYARLDEIDSGAKWVVACKCDKKDTIHDHLHCNDCGNVRDDRLTSR